MLDKESYMIDIDIQKLQLTHALNTAHRYILAHM